MDRSFLDRYEDNEVVEIPSDWASIRRYHQTITLNDGTVLDGTAIRSSIANEIWINPAGTDYGYAEIVTIFADPNKTSLIQCNLSEKEFVEYRGYTRLSMINSNIDGTFSVCMTKPIE